MASSKEPAKKGALEWLIENYEWWEAGWRNKVNGKILSTDELLEEYASRFQGSVNAGDRARVALRSNEYLEVFWGDLAIRQFEGYERVAADKFAEVFNLNLSHQFRLSVEAIDGVSKDAARKVVFAMDRLPTSTLVEKVAAIIRAEIDKVVK